MSQHDFDIANQTAPNTRADLNLALKALASNSSGASAPTTTYANMIYYNTSTNILYKRNEADSAWISLGTVDESLGTFTPSGFVLASQAEAEAGTENTKVMTPLRVSQAIESSYTPFVSSEYNPARDLRQTIAHGLGRHPYNLNIILTCQTAELGYSIGDQVHLSSGVYDVNSANGINVSADSTNVYLGLYWILIRHKTTGTGGPGTWVEITYANWKIKVIGY